MYICLSRQLFEDTKGYGLVSLREEDLEPIRLWRNAQKDILRQNEEITPQKQLNYFHQVIHPSFSQKKPSQILFSFLLHDRHGHDNLIGYGGLTHIDWDNKRAEVSFLLDPLRTQDEQMYSSDFLHFLALLSEVASKELHLHRIFTETFSFRTHHMKVLEEAGFQLEGILREHVFKNGTWSDSILHGLLLST